MKTKLKYSHIAADAIQMINRGCCRRIINGKAPKIKVSILLPESNGVLIDVILRSIQSEMSDITINVLDAQFVTRDPFSSYDGNIVVGDQELIKELIIRNTDKIKISELLNGLELTKRNKERVRAHLNKDEHSNTYLAHEVILLGYRVITERNQLFLLRVEEA